MSDTMNSEAARDRRQRFGAQRGRDLYWGFTLGLVVNTATMFMISMGGGLPKLGITAAIVGTFIFVCVNSFDCMDDFKANADDMGDEERATNLGKKFLDAPWVMFKTLIVVIFGVSYIAYFFLKSKSSENIFTFNCSLKYEYQFLYLILSNCFSL